jgi:tRNA(Ile)-lysidine synthase
VSAASDTPVAADEAAALFADLSKAPVVILAVSGGPDSTALLWLAARWRARRKRGPKLIAVTVDHGLRPESAREALAVRRLARRLDVAHRTLRWSGNKPKTGIQQTARAARYRLLGDAARKAGARHVVTAHTLDDQAETVLFRLARGSGITGLRGMVPLSLLPASAERELALVRPLLGLPKSRLLATLAAAKIPFADDPSNRDPHFTRPRLRELMPRLEAEGLDTRRLAAFARRMARADEAIERAVEEAMKRLSQQPSAGAGLSVPTSDYADLPAEIGLRLLGRAIDRAGNEGSVELGKLEALHAALAAALAETGRSARFRRTLAGAMVTLSADTLTVERAPGRRAAQKSRNSTRKAAFTKSR